MINVIDIEAIEPIQGTRFELRFLKHASYFARNKTVKVDVYESKYLAEILDAYEQICLMAEDAALRLETFTQIAGKRPVVGLLTQRMKEAY